MTVCRQVLLGEGTGAKTIDLPANRREIKHIDFCYNSIDRRWARESLRRGR